MIAASHEIQRIALLYPGDLGSVFGAALLRAGFRVASFVAERSERTRRAAAAAGILRRESLEALLADADLIVSLVPQAGALATARRCAAVLRELALSGQRDPEVEAPRYLDANSIAPAALGEIAGVLDAAGVRTLDGAFLGSARELAERGSLALAGPGASEVGAQLERALRVRVLGDRAGDASAFKLCFSAFNKAVVAAGFESLVAAERAGFGAELLEALREFYPGAIADVERQTPTYPRHAARRADEMQQVAGWLDAVGFPAELARAASACFERIARERLALDAECRAEDVWRALAQRAARVPGRCSEGSTVSIRVPAPAAAAAPAIRIPRQSEIDEGETKMSADQRPQSSELHPGPGFRIRHQVRRPDPALVQAFREFQGPMISDLMNRLYTMRPAIQNLTDPALAPLVGPACTVKVFPGDNLMVHAALDIAKPGDVLVVDASGSHMNAVLGDLVSNKAKHRGIAGIIVDGLVRDIDGIREARIPVFARGVTPVGPLHRGPGEVNFPIQCGGIVVKPGDLIFADNNGVVVVPLEISEELLKRCQEKTAKEASYVASVKQGKFSNAWVHAELAMNGCVFVDDAPEPAASARSR
jgi:RraA family protein